MKVQLIVPLVAQDGKADELRKEAAAMLPPTHAEPGNEFYRVYESETPGHFFFHELWQSQQAFDAHLQTAHFKRFSEVTKNLLANPIEINKVHELA
jgi:quinol monooxygenase YgiN